MGGLRGLWRALRVAEHLVTGALICLFIRFVGRREQPPSWVPRVVCWWHGRLCRALGVRVRVSGAVGDRCLLVANHVSWLDIPVLGGQAELGFLSKAEVRDWPLVGWMSAVAGTLFIERGANQAATVSAQIAGAIAAGRTLVIFPEGTTSDGRAVRPFHPRLFAAARQPGLRVQPVAIGYRRGWDQGPDLVVPFVGDDTLVANLWRVIRHPHLIAEVRFLPPLEPQEGEDRKRFAARARSAIVQALGLPLGPRGQPEAAPRPPGPLVRLGAPGSFAAVLCPSAGVSGPAGGLRQLLSPGAVPSHGS